ncbi:MAG: amidohydrolase family protein [Clostridia bacterium]|nr:amidohydrolase family protein [Clostridia bacterium]
MINEKVIDTHLHIEAWDNEEFNFIDCFEEYRTQSGIHSLNICALPTVQRSACNNMMCAFYKIAHPNTYAHGAFEHIFFPIREDMPKGMDLVTQYKELMEIGFDGIKMIEGKPTVHKTIGRNLNTPSLEKVYSEMEKDQTHIVFHVGDPADCWDINKTSELFIEKGWFYGDGTHSTLEELYSQAEAILKNHPNIKITFAHFYFCGENPQKLIDLFEKYPNLCVDLTPGCEMYHSFEKNREYFKDFFKKYSSRVLLGTDATFPMLTRCHTWCIDRLSRYIATSDEMMAFDDSILTGIALEGEAKENILYKNFEHRVGDKPKEINKKALSSYIEKYKHLLNPEDLEKIESLSKKYL